MREETLVSKVQFVDELGNKDLYTERARDDQTDRLAYLLRNSDVTQISVGR